MRLAATTGDPYAGRQRVEAIQVNEPLLADRYRLEQPVRGELVRLRSADTNLRALGNKGAEFSVSVCVHHLHRVAADVRRCRQTPSYGSRSFGTS